MTICACGPRCPRWPWPRPPRPLALGVELLSSLLSPCDDALAIAPAPSRFPVSGPDGGAGAVDPLMPPAIGRAAHGRPLAVPVGGLRLDRFAASAATFRAFLPAICSSGAMSTI